MASRYNSYDSRSSTTSYFSDPSSSAELSYKHSTSRAIVKSKPADLSKIKVKNNGNDHNLSKMVKKFMEKKSVSSASSKGSSSKAVGLVIPSDLIAEDLKKTARKGTGFMGLQKKLFGKENKEKKEVKALTEAKVNSNTRTLAMVLKSERELLSANKEQELEIDKLKLMLEDKNREVEKLKDLCLKQREEIRSLKRFVLFPDAMNSQLQELLKQRGSELKQAKQLIPTLQRQGTSLTGQLQCHAEDLAEVKADKYARAHIQYHGSSPGTPTYDHEETANSLEFEAIGYESSLDGSLSGSNTQMSNELSFSSHVRKLSKSSDCYQNSNTGSTMTRATRRSDESKGAYRKHMQQQRHF
ncbi:PREDICTED: uncharacterized protein LOC105110989 isoform X2 [Populus euphratica]|uniref:Uncharacterized protein LOC105110989 isoform X2 n=1 Tax=Populus euphratica TaxID=75702 RepID=A0AAJ6X3Z9_POPEU|nr:PREDICTED: uncharacterized protein LOC105110989 isoform X2 [Populus euphratica]